MQISFTNIVVMIFEIIFLPCLKSIQGLVQCNGNITKLQLLCSLEADYDARRTGAATVDSKGR